MSVEKVHDPNGEIAWRVRWWQDWRPRSRVFNDKSEADAFQKEVRQRKRVITLRLITLAIAALAFVVGVVLLWDMRHREPVASAFTRVGGATRVETAIEASRFWLASGPKFVVVAREDADPQLMWLAAWCAVAHNAPLLFTSTKANRKRLVEKTIDSWPSHPKRLNLPDAEASDCRATDGVHAPKGLSTLRVASASFLAKRVTPLNKLAPVVVFAAAKTPSAAPDVVVGLALAAHMARERDVSLVVVPRYLQADRELEHALRVRDEVIEDGVVLGQTGILSEDVRALLREVITSSNRKGVLGEARTTLGSLEPVIATLLALLGLGAASRAATELAKERVGRIPPPAESLTETPLWRNTMNTMATAARVLHIGGAHDDSARDRPQAVLPTDRALTVQLRSRSSVTGVYAGYANLDTVPFLKLGDARLEAADQGGKPRGASASTDEPPSAPTDEPPSAPTDETPAEFILVAVTEIELIMVPPVPATKGPQV